MNGFGFGGANAHVILDAADTFLRKSIGPAAVANRDDPGPGNAKKYLLAFSSHDQATLNGNRDAILSVAHKYEMSDLAYTLAAHRSRLQHRGFCIWNNACLSTELQESKFGVAVSRNFAPSIAFVFTGELNFRVKRGCSTESI